MSRAEFMNQLAGLLGGISESERQEALNYYHNYFDDAGVENESKVIQELGSPGKVAAIIKADLMNEAADKGEYTERGYRNEATDDSEVPAVKAAADRSQTGYHVKKEQNWSKIILIIILLVITSPAWLGIAGGLLGVLVGVIAVVLAGVLCLAAFALSGFAAGVFIFIKGILVCVSQPALGVMSLGVGLLSIAVGVLCTLAFVWLVAKVFPVCIRWIVDQCQKLIQKGRNRA